MCPRMVQRTPDVPVWPGPPYAPKVIMIPCRAYGHQEMQEMQCFCAFAFLQAPYSQHSHHKSQTFVVQKGYALEQPPIPGDSQATPSPCTQENFAQEHAEQQQQQQNGLTQSSAPLSRTPKWIENDGKASAAVLFFCRCTSSPYH